MEYFRGSIIHLLREIYLDFCPDPAHMGYNWQAKGSKSLLYQHALGRNVNFPIYGSINLFELTEKPAKDVSRSENHWPFWPQIMNKKGNPGILYCGSKFFFPPSTIFKFSGEKNSVQISILGGIFQ